MINPAFQTIIGALVGLLGGLSLNANARDTDPESEMPLELDMPAPEPEAPKPYDDPQGTVFIDTPEDDDDDELEPWEKYRSDLRYVINSDCVVDEEDFPDWRSAGK
jgi:hypothetical protein